jgi:hypothetical protein
MTFSVSSSHEVLYQVLIRYRVTTRKYSLTVAVMFDVTLKVPVRKPKSKTNHHTNFSSFSITPTVPP